MGNLSWKGVSMKQFGLSNNIYQMPLNLLKILLHDYTTQKPIVWGTSLYAYLGTGFEPYDCISPSRIIGYMSDFIQPRASKPQGVQKSRTKVKAEVFTPAWLVNKQVQIALVEMQELDFDEYIESLWLEIACGEGPYIVTRYDAVTGLSIEVNNRVGFLDRKLQRINREIETQNEWFEWVIKAYKATYGYEFQGDSLLLARKNLLFTFSDYFEAKWGMKPSQLQLRRVTEIIAHNIFQMDGLTYTTPFSSGGKNIQLSLFEDLGKENQPVKDTVITNWKTKKTIPIKCLANGEISMKFDVVIGNPPYQEEIQGENTQTRPLYHLFIDEANKISSKTVMVTPARFLANTGATPKKWNEKILKSRHVKIAFYELKSSNVFPNTDIKGGVVITYHDETKDFEPIDTFIAIKELDSIYRKVSKVTKETLNSIMYGADSHKFTEEMFVDHPNLLNRTDKSHRYAVASKVFDRYPEVFFEERPDDGEEYVQICGRVNGDRVTKYLKSPYLREHPNLKRYKVLVPESNGSGAVGERLSTPLIGTPLIGTPLIGYSQTFISIGAFMSENEAVACMKYVNGKFARVMLGILKLTQHNPPSVWAKVPMQDFSDKSDIDWSQSVSDIDRQLYVKYGLSEKEIEFIETKVKEMN